LGSFGVEPEDLHLLSTTISPRRHEWRASTAVRGLSLTGTRGPVKRCRPLEIAQPHFVQPFATDVNNVVLESP
jgi:hypothetical protein